MVSVYHITLSYRFHHNYVFYLFHLLGNSPVMRKFDRPIRCAAYAIAALFCLTPFASPPLALALGGGLALLVANPLHRPGQRAAKYLLQGCVVLLGFGM